MHAQVDNLSREVLAPTLKASCGNGWVVTTSYARCRRGKALPTAASQFPPPVSLPPTLDRSNKGHRAWKTSRAHLVSDSTLLHLISTRNAAICSPLVPYTHTLSLRLPSDHLLFVVVWRGSPRRSLSLVRNCNFAQPSRFGATRFNEGFELVQQKACLWHTFSRCQRLARASSTLFLDATVNAFSLRCPPKCSFLLDKLRSFSPQSGALRFALACVEVKLYLNLLLARFSAERDACACVDARRSA